MICFKDRSFCAESAQCGNTECPSRWNEDLAYSAKRWWGSDNAPVAFQSMKERCGKFMEVSDAG